MIDIINEYSGRSIYDLFYDFNNSKSILKNYIRYFILNELIIVSDDISPYVSISNDFVKPYILDFILNELIIVSDDISPYVSISNDFVKPYILDTISIEIESLEPFIIDFISNEIDKLGVISLKLIIKKEVVKNLLEILALLKTSKIQSISLFIEFSEEIEEQLKEKIAEYPRLTEVIFCNTAVKRNLLDLNFYYEILSFEEILYKKSKK